MNSSNNVGTISNCARKILFTYSGLISKWYKFSHADNLVENLLEDFEFEIQVPYLLYRNAAQEVNGIWFYNPRECEEVANLFTRYSPVFVWYIDFTF